MSDEKQKAIALFFAGVVVISIGGLSALFGFESLRLSPPALIFLGGGVAFAGAAWFGVQIIMGK